MSKATMVGGLLLLGGLAAAEPAATTPQAKEAAAPEPAAAPARPWKPLRSASASATSMPVAGASALADFMATFAKAAG